MVRRPLTRQSTATRWQAHAGAEFGAAMDARANEDSGATAVHVGVPGLDVGDAKAAGGVVVLNLTKYIDFDYVEKLPDVHGVLNTLDHPDSPRPPQAGDRLGATLTTAFWGAPGATVDGQPGAGLVVAAQSDIYHLGKDGLPGEPAAGDGFGSSFAVTGDTVWIGVPGRDVDGVRDAGMVAGLRRVERKWEFRAGPVYTEHDVKGARAEQGDHFGAALCAYTHYGHGPDSRSVSVRLLAGAPGKDVDGTADAGMVIGLLDAPTLTADTVGGSITAGARFGARIHCGSGNSGKGNDFLIGAPGTGEQDGVAGAVAHGIHRRGDDSITWDHWTLHDGQPGDTYGNSLSLRDWY